MLGNNYFDYTCREINNIPYLQFISQKCKTFFTFLGTVVIFCRFETSSKLSQHFMAKNVKFLVLFAQWFCSQEHLKYFITSIILAWQIVEKGCKVLFSDMRFYSFPITFQRNKKVILCCEIPASVKIVR